MPRLSSRLLAARRTGIVRAAARCLARQGVSATGMRDVFRASNLSPGAVYRYFRGKAELVAAVAAEAPLTADRMVAAGGSNQGSAGFPQELFGAAAAGGSPARLEIGLRAAALADGELGRALGERRKESIDRLAATGGLQQLAERLGWPPERLARLLLALGDGVSAAALDSPSAASELASDAARLIERATDGQGV